VIVSKNESDFDVLHASTCIVCLILLLLFFSISFVKTECSFILSWKFKHHVCQRAQFLKEQGLLLQTTTNPLQILMSSETDEEQDKSDLGIFG